jgi:single-stranded-DNA-specific exonuclease
VARGFKEPEDAKSHLRPDADRLHSPESLRDLPLAVDRILRAVDGGEPILVHGDYDVDGMTGATLLTRCVRLLGGKALAFLPHRLRDGYDLGPAGLRAAEEAGAALIVTVDSGILAHDAVREAGGRRIDVIVTDHHAPGHTLPPAVAVVNPNRDDCDYPNKGLCGAGVSFKLCQALMSSRRIPAEQLHAQLDLVALATVADLVPLTGENRILARLGLRQLSETRNQGLRALMTVAGVDPGSVTSGSIGFNLAPRLNALGRLGEPERALALLMTENAAEARALAEEADALNRRRQELDSWVLEDALRQLAGSYDPDADYGLVLSSDQWHPGVVGIAASRVVERMNRPAILVAMGQDSGRGSARSVPGFHVLEAIRAGGEHLVRFGGHRQAAGIEVARENLPAFRAAFNAAARDELAGADLRPSLTVDVEIRLDEVTWDLHRYLRHLGPHGIGNPQPLFLTRGVTFPRPGRVVGTGHLKARLRQGATDLEAIGFRLADRLRPEVIGQGPFDVVYQLRTNDYRGTRSLQAHLKDLRRSSESDAP